MTLTRELRTSIAFILAIFLALTAFVWGNQRLVHADTSLADQILCWIDETDGVHPPVPYFNVGDCDGGPVVPPPPQCFDGIDNDNDGKTDWDVPGGNGDPGCSTPTDNDESDDPVVPPAAQCSDGVDNDQDGLVDYPADPGCTSADDDTESPNPADTGPACSDGVDNDQDGKIDMADPGCSSPSDDDETDGQGGGGDSPQCSDGVDNDSDGQTDYPADSNCTDAQDDNEADEGGGGSNDDDGDSSGGGSHHHRSSGGSSNNNNGEVLGAETECPMYLTGYIKYGANNDAGEVAKLQVFLNNFEGNALPITGTYGPATLAAVNAFQNKYAADILTPWGARGATGYVYYTTQKQINTIYCKFQKDFPLTAGQIEEIAYVRAIQPTIHAQGAAGTTAGAATISEGKGGPAPVVGQVVLPQTTTDENARVVPQSAAAASASSTQGWFTKFVNWLFGR
ncbi:MAG: peptidoglycan-binding protein [Candidatus Pacebacteria bacterium]|nr:peptidoglycan-binding protein [Candidatus Paceibacterota bacterium]